MRILFISTMFPDSQSPARGTYNAALCRALADQDEVRVISPRMFTEVWSRRGRYQVPVDLRHPRLQITYPTYWYTPKIWQHRYGDQMWWSVRREVRRTLKEFQPEAVLSYFAHPDGQVGLQAAQSSGIPSAVIVGGTDVLVLPNDPLRGPAVKRVLHQTSAIMTVSDGLRSRCVELGCRPEQVHTIYQGIDTDIFYPGNRLSARRKLNLAEDHELILWVGRMVPIKGLELLINAFARIRDKRPAARLFLLGDGPSKADVQRQAQRLGISDSICCTGAVGHDELPDWYRAADLCVLSSLSEGLPNVFREALACGTPFVSTDIGSIREIADPTYATLVNSRNPDEFAAALMKTLEPSFQAAATRYRPRTWKQCAEEVLQMFSAVQANGSSASPVRPAPGLVPMS